MEKLTRSPLFYTSLILAILLGFQTYNLVSAYTAPAGSPPNAGNVAEPLDTGSSRQFKSGNLVVGTNATPNVEINGAGVAKVIFNESGSYTGGIYLQGGKLYAQATNQNGGTPFEIGSGIGGGAAVTAPLTLQTGSGGIGIILKTKDDIGTNSPMVVFSGFGASIGMAVQQKLGLNVFPVAHALTSLPCDANIDIGCNSGGGGGGNVGTPDPLTQPIWWMRQEGTAFALHASAADLSDVRDVATFTRGGAVVAKGFFVDQGSTAARLDPVLSGTWCGLNTGGLQGTPGIRRWDCGGSNPFISCPTGYTQFAFGSNDGLGKNWWTCIKN